MDCIINLAISLSNWRYLEFSAKRIYFLRQSFWYLVFGNNDIDISFQTNNVNYSTAKERAN